jgi:hypothetical protein
VTSSAVAPHLDIAAIRCELLGKLGGLGRIGDALRSAVRQKQCPIT